MTSIKKLLFSITLASGVLATVAHAAENPQVASGQPAVQDADAGAPSMELPSGTVGSYLASQFARSEGDLSQAINYLKRAHKQTPANAEIVEQLQALLLLNGNVEEAIRLAESSPKTSRGNSLSTMLLALKHFKKEDFTQAHAVLGEVNAANSGQLWIPLFSAWIDIKRQAFAEPLKIDALKVDVTRSAALVYYHMALINARAGFIDVAAGNFKDMVANMKSPPPRVLGMLVKFYEANQKPQALKPIVDAIGGDRQEIMVSSDDVGSIFRPVDGLAEVLFTMGNVALAGGATHDAVIYLHLAHYLKPEFPMLLINLGDIYAELKQYEKSNALYGQIKNKTPLSIRAHLRIAANLDQMGKLQEAMQYLDRMDKANGGRYEYLVAKADLLRARRRFAEAIETYTEALKRLPSVREEHWPLLFSRGVSYERQGNWIASTADLEKALVLRPNQPDVLNYLGYSLLTRGERVEEARQMIEKAVKERPNDPQIVDSMGWALYLTQQYSDALPYLERALELLPSDPTINDHLGDVYWKLGRKTEARYQWERSLTYSPEENEVEVIRRKIESGLPPESSASVTKAPVIADGRSVDSSVQ